MNGAETTAQLLYDDDCNFCRWALLKILRWDRQRRLRPVALQDPEAETLLAGMTPQARMASWHLVIDGKVWSGGRAMAPLAAMLPGGGLIAAGARTWPGLVERLYRTVATNRDWLGRLLGLGSGSCQISRDAGEGRPR